MACRSTRSNSRRRKSCCSSGGNLPYVVDITFSSQLPFPPAAETDLVEGYCAAQVLVGRDRRGPASGDNEGTFAQGLGTSSVDTRAQPDLDFSTSRFRSVKRPAFPSIVRADHAFVSLQRLDPNEYTATTVNPLLATLNIVSPPLCSSCSPRSYTLPTRAPPVLSLLCEPVVPLSCWQSVMVSLLAMSPAVASDGGEAGGERGCEELLASPADLVRRACDCPR